VKKLQIFITKKQGSIGSWLNLVETLFVKMARTFLNKIRVKSTSELKNRILKRIQDIN